MQDESAPAAHERNFAAQLRLVRESRGMSQAELARAATECGAPMQQQTVAKIERGGQTISLDQAGAIAMALGRPLAEMLQPPEESFTIAQAEGALGRTLDSVEQLRVELAAAEHREDAARRTAQELRTRLAEQQERARLLTQRLADHGGGRYESADGSLSVDPAEMQIRVPTVAVEYATAHGLTADELGELVHLMVTGQTAGAGPDGR